MRFAIYAWLFCLLLLPLSIQADQTAGTSAQGLLLLRQAFSAMVGTVSISDVTLTGTARRIAGSDDETGSVVLKAIGTGQSRIDFSFASGQSSEVRSISSDGIPEGNWSGPDGTTHAMSQHNLMTASSWFQPALALGALIGSQSPSVALVGQETRDGISVLHVTASQPFPDAAVNISTLMQHLSQTDVFLDATTLLPVALDFDIHPDNNALLDIPVDVRFSDYRTVSGVQVPFHVQKYLNNSLVLDIQLQIATFNSGLSASAFAIQ
jgi:hypothetical protein